MRAAVQSTSRQRKREELALPQTGHRGGAVQRPVDRLEHALAGVRDERVDLLERQETDLLGLRDRRQLEALAWVLSRPAALGRLGGVEQSSARPRAQPARSQRNLSQRAAWRLRPIKRASCGNESAYCSPTIESSSRSRPLQRSSPASERRRRARAAAFVGANSGAGLIYLQRGPQHHGWPPSPNEAPVPRPGHRGLVARSPSSTPSPPQSPPRRALISSLTFLQLPQPAKLHPRSSLSHPVLLVPRTCSLGPVPSYAGLSPFADHPNDAEGRGRVVSDAERSEARGTDRTPPALGRHSRRVRMRAGPARSLRRLADR
jgi:hypothetical protein